MKLTSSYSKSMDAFTFVDEEPLFNFEATENMSLADLIPEIDALYGVIQYPSFDCFKDKSIWSSVEAEPKREAIGVQNDSKATNEGMSQPSIQLFADIVAKSVNSEAQSTKVEQEYLTSLSKIGQDSRREDLEHLQQNHTEKSQQLGENRNKHKTQIDNKESLIVLEEEITAKFQKKKEKSLTISQRQNDVKLKKMGKGTR